MTPNKFAWIVLAAVILALLSMTGCARSVREPPVQTKIVEVDRPVQTALDPRLTRDPVAPAPPKFACRDKKNRPTPCGEAVADHIQSYQKMATDVKGQIKAIRELQPKSTP